MDTNEQIGLVFTRNYFYRQQYFLALGAYALSLCVLIALLVLFLFVRHHPPHPIYFASDDVTHLIEVTPVTQPNMPIEGIMSWTKEAVRATYSYDFINYRNQLQSAQKYYTDYGWDKYIAALTASDNLLALQKYKYVVSAEVVDEPTLVGQAYVGGALAWKFTMPVLVTYMQPPYDGSEGSKFSNPLQVTVVVQRRPILQSYQGLGIVQLIATWGQGGS